MTKDIEKLIADGLLDEAISLLSNALKQAPADDNLLFKRGKLLWKKGDIAGAMNDYCRAAQINPDSPAAIALEHAHDVQQFFNPDILNP